MRHLRLVTLSVALLALAGSVLSPGCADTDPPFAPYCIEDPSRGGGEQALTCAATATFCAEGVPNAMGECSAAGVEVVSGFEPFPGASTTCTDCLLSTGTRRDPAETCQYKLCSGCQSRSAARRCISCTATVVAVGPGGCTVSGITIPRGGVVGSGGVDAGSPPADSGSAEPRFVVDTYSYGGGTSFGTDVIGHIDIEGEFGRPTAISADELLWVGFRTGVLRGYDIATGEVEITVLVHTDPAGTPNRINNLQMYRDSGRLFGVAALGVGIARFEIVGTSLVDRGFVRTSFSTDARIHPNEVLRDDGYVVGVTVPGTANELIVIPRIDSTGAFAPQTTSLTLTPRSVAPEAVANGFVFTGERNLVDGAAETFRTCASGTPSTCSAGDLTLVGSAEFTGATVMGIGGPDETATVAFDLIVAVNGATVGSLIAFDPVTYATRDTMMLDGLVSTFATRAVGSELYAFATTTATGRAPAELVAVIPTAGLSVRAMRELSSVDQVIDLAVGLEPFFEPPEPDDPLPVGSTAAIHLLIERP